MRCFCVLGPAQAGKSTLINRLASLESRPESTGIGDGLALTRFGFFGEQWGAIDCPGAIESLHHAKRALMAADIAVICVKPDPESAVLAAPYLRAAEASGTPSILFVNRMDETNARLRDIVAALQGYAAHAIALRQVPIRTGGVVTGAIDLISERAWKYREGQPSTLIEIPDSAAEREHEARDGLLEELSELDDWLLEELIEEREPAVGPLYEICTRALRDNIVTPAFLGSAEHNNGVMRLMKALRHETPPLEDLRKRLADAAGTEPEELRAVGFYADHRKHVGKLMFLRSFDAELTPGAPIAGGTLGGFSGHTGPLAAGEIAAAAKSEHLTPGHAYSKSAALPPPPWLAPAPPMISRVLAPIREADEAKLSVVLGKLAEDEPGLTVSSEPSTGRPVAGAQGPGHLRALCVKLQEIFSVEVETRPLRDSYRETITRPVDAHYRHRKQSGGAGQFADVKLSVAPLPRGADFQFEEVVKGGAVPRNYIPAVETGARDAMEQGPLGFPVVDTHVTLTDGQHHAVDSSDLAFRIAGRMGVGKALADAAPVLLRPIHRVIFHAPSDYSGALSPMVSSLRGQVLGFERDPEAKGWDIFQALLPQSALEEVGPALRSTTQGVGWFEHGFDHYEEFYGREADKVVTQRKEEKAAGQH